MRWQRVNNYLLMIEPGIEVYLTPELEKTLDETAVQQLVNASLLPGVQRCWPCRMSMPGTACRWAGVMATRTKDGVISPGRWGWISTAGSGCSPQTWKKRR